MISEIHHKIACDWAMMTTNLKGKKMKPAKEYNAFCKVRVWVVLDKKNNSHVATVHAHLGERTTVTVYDYSLEKCTELTSTGRNLDDCWEGLIVDGHRLAGPCSTHYRKYITLPLTQEEASKLKPGFTVTNYRDGAYHSLHQVVGLRFLEHRGYRVIKAV